MSCSTNVFTEKAEAVIKDLVVELETLGIPNVIQLSECGKIVFISVIS